MALAKKHLFCPKCKTKRHFENCGGLLVSYKYFCPTCKKYGQVSPGTSSTALSWQQEELLRQLRKQTEPSPVKGLNKNTLGALERKKLVLVNKARTTVRVSAAGKKLYLGALAEY